MDNNWVGSDTASIGSRGMCEHIRELECLNLQEQFGTQFKVQYEESYYAQHGVRGWAIDPWLMIIPCKYGHIFPFGGTLLAVSVDGHPGVANKLRRLPFCRVQQDGDFGELTVVFDAFDEANFQKVMEVMRPRKRRQVSESERERLRTMGLLTQWAPT